LVEREREKGRKGGRGGERGGEGERFLNPTRFLREFFQGNVKDHALIAQVPLLAEILKSKCPSPSV
jgi:hypothetical protein